MGNIVLVVADRFATLSAGDTILRDRLLSFGHTVSLASDEDAERDSGTYDGVMVSDSCSGGTVGSKYDTAAKPGITLEATSWRLGTTVGAASITQWDVIDVGDLDAGFGGTTQTVYSTASSQQGLSAWSGGTVVAYQAGGTSKAVYAVWDTGDTLTSGTAPARRVWFRVGDPQITSGAFNATGLTMLDAAIVWAFGSASGPSVARRTGGFLQLL